MTDQEYYASWPWHKRLWLRWARWQYWREDRRACERERVRLKVREGNRNGT